MVVVALYGLTAVATAGTSSKPYSITDNLSSTGVTVAAGATTDYSFAIHDLATTQSIQSAEIVPPNGFTITSVSVPPPAGATATLIQGSGNCPLDQVSPTPSPVTCLVVNNLTITPGSTETISFSAKTSCAVAPSDTFGLEVQQANQFNGKPGNQSGPLTDPAALGVTVNGSCTLEFVAGNEPADANPSATISNESYTTIPPAGPIEVEALDGLGNTVSGAPVTLAIDLNTSPDPGKNAQLAGAPVTPTDNSGIASFDTANIAQPGDYVLQANSPGFAPADSSLSGFLIGSGAACPANTTCSANTNDPKNGQKDNLTATTSTDGTITVIVGLDSSSFCTINDGMSHAPDVTTTAASNLTALGTFGKELTVKFASKLGPGHYAVCWQGDNGPVVDPVPACGKLTQPVTSACLLSPISKDNTTGLINEDVLVPIDDPNRSW